MTDLEHLERHVRELTPAELAEFRSWFLEIDWGALGPHALPPSLALPLKEST